MSYAAPTVLERRAILSADPPPRSIGDVVLERMVEQLRETGAVTLMVDRNGDSERAGIVARWLMNELCEPVTVSRVDGGLRFTRERGDRR